MYYGSVNYKKNVKIKYFLNFFIPKTDLGNSQFTGCTRGENHWGVIVVIVYRMYCVKIIYRIVKIERKCYKILTKIYYQGSHKCVKKSN